MLEEQVRAELDKISEIERLALGELKKAPEGTLLIDNANGGPRYYCRRVPADKKGEYLGKNDKNQVRALAQKDYNRRLLKAVEKEKPALERLMKHAEKQGALGMQALTSVYDELPDARKPLVEPCVLPDDEYAKRWLQDEYAGNAHPYGAYSFFTQRGERVRSKSEVIIANTLDAMGVPYKYERPLHLGGYNPIYPDFTVLNKKSRVEYYWEHFGGFDDANYRESVVTRVNSYALAGILPGQRLLMTFETAASPLDTRVVQAIIEKALL